MTSQVRVVIEAMLRCCSPSAASAGEGIRTPPALHARPRSAGPALPNSSRDGHASGPNLEAFMPSALERPRPSPMPVPLDDDECHTSTAMESSAIVSHTMAMETTATTGAVISGRASLTHSSLSTLASKAVPCPARMDPSEAPGAFARLMSPQIRPRRHRRRTWPVRSWSSCCRIRLVALPLNLLDLRLLVAPDRSLQYVNAVPEKGA